MNLKLAKITLKRPKTPRKHKYRRSKSFFIKFLSHIFELFCTIVTFPKQTLTFVRKIVTQCDGFQVAWVTSGLTWARECAETLWIPCQDENRRTKRSNYKLIEVYLS